MTDLRDQPLSMLLAVCWPLDAQRLAFLTGESESSADQRLASACRRGTIKRIAAGIYGPIGCNPGPIGRTKC